MTPGEHRRAVGRSADDLVRALIGRRDVAAGPAAGCSSRRPRNENTGRGSSPGCVRIDGVVERAAVEARRRAGLQAPDPERQLAQARREAVRRRVPDASAFAALEPDVHASAEEGADRQHDRARRGSSRRRRHDAGDATARDDQVRDFRLQQFKPGLRLEQVGGSRAYRVCGRLRPRRAHGRTLARVQGAELDARAIGGARHRAAQRVDLADQVPLADAADRRDCSSSARSSRGSGSRAACARPSAPPLAQPRCRRGRRR